MSPAPPIGTLLRDAAEGSLTVAIKKGKAQQVCLLGQRRLPSAISGQMSTTLPRHERDSRSFVIDSEKASSSSTMPSTRVDTHHEPHKGHGALIRDSIIGFSDGLTVPFALTAGLSSLGSSKIVVLGGLAELFAGSISMGLGAYLASTTDKKHYEQEEKRERREVEEKPEAEEEEIYAIFEKYGVTRAETKPLVDGLKANKDNWVQVSRLVSDHVIRTDLCRSL